MGKWGGGLSGRRDANEGAIVERLEKMGLEVMRFESPSPFDLWVLDPDRKVTFHMEVKNPEIAPKHRPSSLKDSQKKAIAAGWPIHLVETPDEAEAVVRRYWYQNTEGLR